MYDNNGDYLGFIYNGTEYYYIKNAENDVVAIADENANILVRYYYNAWGQIIGSQDTSGINLCTINPITYRSYYRDDMFGTYMYYLNSRYYYPQMCRFLNADTTDIVGVQTDLYDKNLYAYCDNNPTCRVDTTGYFWETAFDVISLGASIVEVAINPTDIWAWAGLVGDTIDLLPFMTGAGELTRAVKLTRETVKKGDDVIDAAKSLYKLSDSASDIKKATGSYEILFNNGYSYIGKGGFDRAITSAKTHSNGITSVVSIKWKSAPDATEAFIDEYLMQKRFGGTLSYDSDLRTYNKIWSPGKKYYGN